MQQSDTAYNHSLEMLKLILFSILSLISLIIFLAVFFSITFKDINREKKYQRAECSTTNFTETPSGCCIATQCKCEECDASVLCDALTTSLVEGRCCGETACCKTKCRTCYRTETYHCKRNILEEKGTPSDVSLRSTCSRQVSYSCNCHCSDSVNRETCYSKCGTCYDLVAILNVKVRSNPGEEFSYVHSQHCSIDDTKCVDKFKNKWDVPDSSRTCFWDGNDVHWSKYHYNIAAVFFASLFGLVFVVSGGFAVFFGVKEYFREGYTFNTSFTSPFSRSVTPSAPVETPLPAETEAPPSWEKRKFESV